MRLTIKHLQAMLDDNSKKLEKAYRDNEDLSELTKRLEREVHWHRQLTQNLVEILQAGSKEGRFPRQ